MKPFRVVNRGCIVRVLFYGLFLLGPYILTESHSLYVRAKRECLKIEDVAIRERAQNEYKWKVRFLDCLGISCFGVWFAWLMVMICMKLIQARNIRRELSKYTESNGDC